MGDDFSDLPEKEKIEGDGERRPGRAAFVPTEEQRQQVRQMAAQSAVHEEIANAIGVSVPTLRKVCAAELKDRLGDANLFSAAGQAMPGEAPAPVRAKRPGAGGRKQYQPQDRDREKVAVLIATGMRAEEIALSMGITEPTLRKHFKVEIETAHVRKRAELHYTLFVEAKKGNVSAIRDMRAIFDQADLRALSDRVSQPKAEEPKEPAVGKKVQADIDAHSVVTKGPWADVIRKPRAG